jgi:type I restriction enzyme S subunit
MTLLVDGKFNVNNHAHIVRGTKNLTSWFYWFFSNRDISSYLTRQGAGRYKLTKATLLTLPCALPPLPEQRAIAAVLSDVDALLVKLDQLIAKKRNLKQAAMQQLLTGQTRLPGFSGEWEVKRLGDVAEVSKGNQLHSDDTNAESDFPHYNGGISPSSYTQKANAPADTIAISEGGNSCGYVQFITQPFWCGGHCYAVVPKGIDKRFLYHALKGRQQAIMGLRVGSGLPNVQKTALKVFSFELPKTVEEQTAIAAALSDMDAELAALEARRDKTRALKQGMMQELLTGRIRLV